jgi:hypothetical protein
VTDHDTTIPIPAAVRKRRGLFAFAILAAASCCTGCAGGAGTAVAIVGGAAATVGGVYLIGRGQGRTLLQLDNQSGVSLCRLEVEGAKASQEPGSKNLLAERRVAPQEVAAVWVEGDTDPKHVRVWACDGELSLDRGGVSTLENTRLTVP